MSDLKTVIMRRDGIDEDEVNEQIEAFKEELNANSFSDDRGNQECG